MPRPKLPALPPDLSLPLDSSLTAATVQPHQTTRATGGQLPPWARIVCDRPELKPSERPKIGDPTDVVRLMAEYAHEDQEHFILFSLDTRSRVIRRHVVTVGTLDSALVHPREVFRRAIADAAAGIIVAHNHPSGDPTPSADDRTITRQLTAAGQLLDLPIYDHVIVAGDRHLSFAGQGLL